MNSSKREEKDWRNSLISEPFLERGGMDGCKEVQGYSIMGLM